MLPLVLWRAIAGLGVATSALLAAACQDATEVSPTRLPPPEIEVVDEGDFSVAYDACAALVASPAVRLSATVGNSTAPAIAVVGALGPDPRVLVAWIEADDPIHGVHARLLTADGDFFGPLARLDAANPTSVAVAPFDSVHSFAITIAYGGDLYGIPLSGNALYLPYTGEVPVPVGQASASQGRWVTANRTAPRMAALADRLLTVALGPDDDGDGEADSISVIDAALDASLPEPCEFDSPVPAAAVDIQAEGEGARITWIHDGELRAASVSSECSCLEPEACTSAPWAVPNDAAAFRRNEGIVGTRLRTALVRGRLAAVVARAGAGAIWAQQPDGDWATMRAGGPDQHGAVSFGVDAWEAPEFALGVEPNSHRLVLARPVSERAVDPTEIDLERSTGEGFAACVPPLSCATLTADQRWSFEPEIVALADGFGVVWTDADEPDGPREVYYAKVGCGALPVN